jgi:hypothetical protein
MKLKPGPKRGRGGRKPKPDSLHDTMRIDSELKMMLLCEQKHEERFNDTVKRLLVEKTHIIKELRDEIDRLKQELVKMPLQ